MGLRSVAPVGRHSWLLLVGLLLIASNLRGPITGVAPVLGSLQAVFSLSSAEAGLLTTLPLLAFALVSPFTASLAKAYGLERSVFAGLILIAAGVALRSVGVVWGLYLGTALIGTGIAIGNVLLPSLVKRDFPRSVPNITGATAITMGVAAALVSAAAVPLAVAVGWQWALGASILFPLLAALVWSTRLASRIPPARGTTSPAHGGPIWRSALAWQVTLFIGTNSLLYYVVVTWLPTMLSASGVPPALAGSLHGVLQLSSAIPGLLLGPIVSRMKDQRLITALMSGLVGVALLGFAYRPEAALFWTLLFGFSAGGSFVLALIFMGLRTGSPQQAAALSGMAQCVGYLLAAGGPSLAGRLHETTGTWTTVLTVGAALSVLMAGCGVLAGRARIIGGTPVPALSQPRRR